jgi:EAL domain-containing protein (putative c-di-GMP-specific phosphodiesterase class I)
MAEAPRAPQGDYYRLRAEWLRYKSQLFDALTGLPALPAVMPDVAALQAASGAVDVIYLDLGRSGGHELNLGWAAYDEAVREFAELVASLPETRVLGPGDIVCLHTVRSDRFLIFMRETEQVDLGRGAAARRERVVSALRARIELTEPSSVLRSLRLAAGHARLAGDLGRNPGRAIQQAVTDAVLVSLVEREGIEAVRREELGRLIGDGGVRTVFHPVVRLADEEIIGHEALTRPPAGLSFDSVEELFAFAESTDMLLDFERLCRRTAIASAASLPHKGLLFLNASPGAVEDPDWAGPAMESALKGSGLRPADIVIEITERVAIARHDAFQRALRTFKERGYQVAVDDMGAGYSSLQSLANIQPDFLKFDVSLVRDIDRSSIKRSLLDSLRQLAVKIDARVIAEGVERVEEMATLLDLGIELGQGYHFHREEEQ